MNASFKRIVLVVVLIVLSLSIIACGNDNNGSNDPTAVVSTPTAEKSLFEQIGSGLYDVAVDTCDQSSGSCATK